MKTTDKKPRKLPVEFVQFKIWRSPRELDCDISELKNLAHTAAASGPDTCDEIELTFLENGVAPTPDAVKAIEQWYEGRIEREAWRRAGEGLRKMLLSLPDIPSVLALRAFVFGMNETSLRQASDLAGCSHAAVSKALKKLRSSSVLNSEVTTDQR